MRNALVGLVVAATLVAAGCATNRYRSYDESELVDAAKAQPLATDGTFAEVGADDEWVFVPADPGLDDTSLTVSEGTAFFVGGQPAGRDAIQEGVPVRVTWDPQTNQILQVDVQEAPGAGSEATPGQQEGMPAEEPEERF
jgi:hypothetical protein